MGGSFIPVWAPGITHTTKLQMALDTEEKQKGEAFQMNLKIVMLGLFDSFSFSLYLKIVNASFTDY